MRKLSLLPALLLGLVLVSRAAPARAGALADVAEPRAWAPVVSEAAAALSAHPELGSPELTRTLGQVNVELAMEPHSQAAVSFVSQLPAELARPGALAALPPEARLAALDAAVAAESARLEARVRELLPKARAGALSKNERVELAAAARRWFYLSPAEGDAAIEAVSRARRARTMLFAGRLAAALEDKRAAGAAAAVAGPELSQFFKGAAVVVAEGRGAAPGTLVRGGLAPYAARALDQAEARAVERGLAPGRVYEAVVAKQEWTFGQLAGRRLRRDLRARGEWTEFVAAASLHAAQKLSAQARPPRQLLAKAAEGDDLRLAIPAWHPLFGKYPSIAHWLADAHGKPDDDSKGLLLFRWRGMPVRASLTLWPALILGGCELAGWFAKIPHLGSPERLALGLATVSLLYASVLAHEFGHSAMAALFGIRTRYLVLNFLGGGAAVTRGYRRALTEAAIALAGPAVSALCGGLLLWAGTLAMGTLAAPVLIIAGYLNLVLAVLNLFPMFPMDGFRVLRGGLTRPLGSYRATKAAAWVSGVGSSLLALDGAFLAAAHQPGGMARLAFGLFFLWGSRVALAHPGTVTIDERPQKRR